MSKTISQSMNCQKHYRRYKANIEKRLVKFANRKPPISVYEPIRYVLSSGGKRLRGVLVLLSCEAVGGEIQRALDAAVAIEVLHNFTLVHDDVMDHADLRRGNPTVHRKWNENVAILSGDEMIAQAYHALLNTSSTRLKDILEVYTDALVQVCEGQGFDKEFEKRKNVSIKDYFLMITKKTGRVISASTEIGALIGGGTSQHVTALRNYGKHLGKAFQLMDDLLDITGDPKEFGKIIGGDIKEGKKTFLLLKALNHTYGTEKKLLKSIVPGNAITQTQIEKIKTIYAQSGALKATRIEIAKNTLRAQKSLASLPSSRAKRTLRWLSDQLSDRNS